MIVLALDTTGPHGSLALTQDGRVLEEMEIEAPDGYSAILFGAIDALLQRNHVALENVDLFAAASGPGTFTGVRIGLTSVKGLGEALGKPVCAISNLRALATFGTKDLRAVVLDARRGEVYAALYDAAGNAILPERVSTLDHFRAALPSGDIEFVAYDGPLAGAIAKLAVSGSDPAEIEANYVRRTDAELALKS